MNKYLLVILFLSVAISSFAASKNKKEEQEYGMGKGTVYLFGVSQQLTDSVVYISSISQIDSIDLDKKTKFLPYRSEFSLQMKQYLEGKLNLKGQTVAVFFSDNRKKVAKKFYKIKKRFLDNPDTKIVIIDDNKFRFKHPLNFVGNTEE
ncbi:MAG: hypothetical protein KBT29_00965 [Prevotellaceae bacterium]|nr:hypothetical protein [Candidatus Minthosoma caballi]